MVSERSSGGVQRMGLHSHWSVVSLVNATHNLLTDDSSFSRRTFSLTRRPKITIMPFLLHDGQERHWVHIRWLVMLIHIYGDLVLRVAQMERIVDSIVVVFTWFLQSHITRVAEKRTTITVETLRTDIDWSHVHAIQSLHWVRVLVDYIPELKSMSKEIG